MSDTPTTDALLCPHCKVGLAMSERQGIEIDYCPKCRGVWLDRGELDKIIERNAQQLPPASPDPSADGWGPPTGRGQPYPQSGPFLPETGFGGHGGGHGGHGGDHGNSWLGRLFR